MDQCALSRGQGLACLLLTIFLFSCSPCCSSWIFEKSSSCCPSYQYSRLFLKPESYLNEIGVEMVHSQVDFRIYLDIYCLMIPPYEGDESLGEFKLIVDDEESLWVVNRLEGGQRLLLSPEATEALLTALLHSRSVTVAIGRYNTELTLHNFECDYDKLCAYPSTGS